jgi:hypothetical protein
LVPVAPAMLILVWIVCASRLEALEICEMEDLLRVGDELTFFEFGHCLVRAVYCKSLGKLTI